jgi:hypothetical protein
MSHQAQSENQLICIVHDNREGKQNLYKSNWEPWGWTGWEQRRSGMEGRR